MTNYETTIKNIPEQPLHTVKNLPFPLIGSGKVREIFDLGEHLLIIATDRISAFDVIMPDAIPGKGIVLTQLSLYWFKQTESIIANHLVADHENTVAKVLRDYPHLIARSMVVKKLNPLPIEAIVRGYLSGSGWKSYCKEGTLFGQTLPKGLHENDRLPSAQFTPTTKAHSGHDEPLLLSQCQKILGTDIYNSVLTASLQLYQAGAEKANQAKLILADTKFEFGLDHNKNLFLIDELLTPDSSRYWPADQYRPGQSQPAFDKQFLRDYLEELNWDKSSPAPSLPLSVIQGTRDRYLAALKKLM
jgi:phosphoribosylaminoimidazole-succinocarboxamide synthase